MGIFANVVEWEEYRDDIIFWKWNNKEIKKGSRLIIRPGQDAVFMDNGKIEGIFEDEGSYDIESQIIPVLSNLAGFKFGFNSGMRVEVLFVNTKEFTVKWGTRNPVAIPSPGLPGGLPVRSFGTFNCKVSDYVALIDKIAGVKQEYTIDDIRDRVLSVLDQLLMKWISREGKDMFNLQANAADIAAGIRQDLDMQMVKDGITITGFAISSFSYPEEIQKVQNRAAAQSMVGDMNRYQQMAAADSMANGHSSVAGDVVGMQMGMMMGQQMVNNMQQNGSTANGAKFCPNCGTPVNGAKFCPNCGTKLS